MWPPTANQLQGLTAARLLNRPNIQEYW